MDNIIRYYWVVSDDHHGNETEQTFHDRKAAFRYYGSLTRTAYKKIVACTYDNDVTLDSYTDTAYYTWLNSDSTKSFTQWLRSA